MDDKKDIFLNIILKAQATADKYIKKISFLAKRVPQAKKLLKRSKSFVPSYRVIKWPTLMLWKSS